MPKRSDLKKILIIGSGPIIIGQACEFDYSGTQACRALKEEGYEIVLINSNPATIMTDPEIAHHTYIEPLTPEVVEKVIIKEKPQALLPTMGGQTALNLAVDLYDSGTLDRHGVELIGADSSVIKIAEDRELFKTAMVEAGLDVVCSSHTGSVEEALEFASTAGYPLVIRPSFTLGGGGGGIANNREELCEKVSYGLDISPVSRVLVEEAIIGWKEIELEVMRDRRGNTVIICSIENVDPMGVHTGESITVAPVQTLTDREYQAMRNAAIIALHKVGITTGGCNIQFAFDPGSDRMVVIEMNPRVSRSSALASKATGFPIAKIAARLSVGYTLDELPNDITLKTPASFEPVIDYCIVKIPRWDFAKFPEADSTLTTHMKSVGEVMGIGRNFREALQKALRSLEQDYYGLESGSKKQETRNKKSNKHLKEDFREELSREDLIEHLTVPRAERIFYIAEAYRSNFPGEEIYELTKINRWFLDQIESLVRQEEDIKKASLAGLTGESLLQAKKNGFSDRYIATLIKTDEETIRRKRLGAGIKPSYRCVDTCAGEFEAYTPYYYSTYEDHCEIPPSSSHPRVMILGSGPNRIGQGVEFDYCCVQAAMGLRNEGYEVIMVNCNPETVSTDYDISDRLYFEPLTLEDVLHIYEVEKPEGIILQFGGQTPLKLALPLMERGVKIWGTSPADINRAENRKEFAAVVEKLNLSEPPYGTAASPEEALRITEKIGYPVLARPSYVLGGQSMQIVYNQNGLEEYLGNATEISAQKPLLLDKFLEGAVEIDVDAVCDGTDTFIGGIMEHVEHAGIHSGDSSCVIPTFSLTDGELEELRRQTRLITKALNVVGLCNIQYAIYENRIYIIEANPRASRTIPFAGKATGIPLARLAARIMAGRTISELGLTKEVKPEHFSVKEAVFPFSRFPGVDIILGPEMRSTGEVMGTDKNFGIAYAKAQLAAGTPLPLKGNIFITVTDRDKPEAVKLARSFSELGFNLIATGGTATALKTAGITVGEVKKLQDGSPNILDYINRGNVELIINTPAGAGARGDEARMRQKAIARGVSIITTMRAAKAALEGITTLQKQSMEVLKLQNIQKRKGEDLSVH